MSESTSKKKRQPARASKRQSDEANDDEGVLDHAEGMLGDAIHVVEQVQHVRQDWTQKLEQSAKRSPYLTLAGAAGTGFVLGGGLSIALTRRLWMVGARVAISLAFQQLTQGSSWFGSSHSDS